MNLRDFERESIRAFVQSAADDGYLSGRVLDYGCGKQPYRDIVEAAGGSYLPFDRASLPANVSGEDVGHRIVGPDTILCTQVIQYMDDPADNLQHIFLWLREDVPNRPREKKALVLTYPTNWPEVEPEDLHRFTKTGMERLLTEAGFTIIRHERRGTLYDPRFPSGREKRITALGEEFAIGYGVICRA